MMRAMLYEAAQSARAFLAMVLAQGLGDADCQAPRHEKGHRRASAPAGRDHAPEWSFWSALIYPASRGSSCSGPSWLSAHT
jgi:hypothetical protein